MCQHNIRPFISQIYTITLQVKYYCLPIIDEETEAQEK